MNLPFNRDPFCQLVDKVHHLILQHIEDVKVTETSMKWNEMFGMSKKFMMNFPLELTDEKEQKLSRTLSSDDKLTQPDRKYSKEIKKFEEALDKSTRKYVKITFDSEKTSKHLEKCMLLAKFSASLVELKVGRICDEIFVEDLQFPKLQTMTISHDDSKKAVMKILKKNRHVKKLVEDSKLSLSENYATEIGGFLIDDNAIEELRFGRYLSHFLFRTDVLSTSKMKLKSLEIQELSNAENLKKFLQSQVTTLEEFSAKTINGEILKILIEKMEKLRKVSLHSVYDFDENFSKKNSTINEIFIKSDSNYMEKLENFLPNLKIINNEIIK